MLNLYSIFVHYVLFFQKKLPPLPPIFQLMWGVLPTLPLSETASGGYSGVAWGAVRPIKLNQWDAWGAVFFLQSGLYWDKF